MVQVKALPVVLCVMGLLSETLCSSILKADVGDKASIWCRHGLADTGYISWFKHTCDSVPLLIGCKRFLPSAPSENCTFFTESERIVMSVYAKNTSLTITAVNVSDTGLYYCSFRKQDKMIFGTSTSLQVKGNIQISVDEAKGKRKTFAKGKEINTNRTLSEEKPTSSVSPPVSFMLIVGFSALGVILLSVLILILKHRKTHTGAQAEDNKVADSDMVNYSEILFSKKKNKGK
ncbi:uncharacterized protein LOC128509498 isoform X2 [Clarias gariepinus]|uniref:uncharacterized protein LOC128509498 isoform X2 n=1 Tax=Clarias gariepinus TaxID=13013 RepID=UPI00234DE55F|nr:uncharacterized protein LOC128509498 isoform X2 [Clarias gariepinus]XP_053337235.1 uncharacterized protein LOC128509498 isoform X2 [Clarias gariepinus]